MNEEGLAALQPAHKMGFYPLVTITVQLNFLIGHNLFLCFSVDVTLNTESLVLPGGGWQHGGHDGNEEDEEDARDGDSNAVMIIWIVRQCILYWKCP